MKRNWFKPRISEEERKVQARMEYQSTRRTLMSNASNLDKTIRKFKQMAYDAMQSGNKDNALELSKFIRHMTHSQQKVKRVLQRFEMLNALQNVSEIMIQFMKNCESVGINLKDGIRIDNLIRGQADMEAGLNRLDYISGQLDNVFDSIDESLGLHTEDFAEGGSEADLQYLDEIVQEVEALRSARAQAIAHNENSGNQKKLDEIDRQLAAVQV